MKSSSPQIENPKKEENKPLTKNEEKVLFGLVKYPRKSDKELASVLEMKDSTLTSIKKRLEQNGYFSFLYIPQVNRLGAELLGIIFASFNPVKKFKDRIKITKDNIEIADEIFYSVGAPEMGFSLSFTKDYTSFCAINEKRTLTFGKEGLLDKEFPNEVIFPFKISNIDEFFDYSRILHKHFATSLKNNEFLPEEKISKVKESKGMKNRNKSWFEDLEQVDLNEKEKRVFVAFMENPKATMQEIGDEVGLSRHTVARMRNKFLENDLYRVKIIPNLKKIGFKLMVFYNLKFSPNNAITEESLQEINTSSTFFLAHRKFRAILISAYPDYTMYKEDKVRKFNYLKKKKLLNYTPAPRKYIYNQMEVIKDFTFANITKKILGHTPIQKTETEE
ncbi:MAG: hypothetical protein ACTSVZ_07750 [Promethearchaeota archaeon]